jgi:hypothetical protein
MRLLENEIGNNRIKTLIESGNSFSIIRLRSETDILKKYQNNQIVDSFNSKYDINGGVINPNKETLVKYSQHIKEGIESSDLLVYWEHLKGQYIDYKKLINCDLTMNRAVEPFYFNNPWSESLKGKKVLVIHPFTESIEKQYSNKDLLFKNKNILPDFELKTYKPYQTSCSEINETDDWNNLLNNMIEDINNIDFDIALIGCGCYDIPLSTAIKNMGKQSIIIGGGLQILFGIKGKRWDTHNTISSFYNDYWIRPSDEEKPKEFRKVEGGCYW